MLNHVFIRKYMMDYKKFLILIT
ncbi:hypothetical protein LINPERPRIM_LOCUS25505 [Linum perenne]